MKKSTRAPVVAEPREEEIRDYAYHLYEQSGCIPGRDLENWQEARACLAANIPAYRSHMRLHRHMHGATNDDLCADATVARNLAGW